MPDDDRARRIRERAHRLWEQEGRPEGREALHWHEAERQLVAEEEGTTTTTTWRPQGPDDVSIGASSASPPADPLRNPEPIPPNEDPEYPAVTGPEEIPLEENAKILRNSPDTPGATQQPLPMPSPAGTVGSKGARRTGPGKAEVPQRPRPHGSTLEP
jgi:hypothetical protein